METEPASYLPGAWNFDLGDGRSISLLSELLPAMTQDESATRTFYGGYRTASVRDLLLIGGKLYDLRDAQGKVGQAVQSACKFIREGIRNNWLNTQTRIRYQPDGNDVVTQDYGTPHAESKVVGFVGNDGEIQTNLTLEQSLALTGKTPKQTEETMSYLNNTPGFVWRVNLRPETVDERVVGLYAYSVRFSLLCWDPQYAGASFGVHLGAKNSESR